MGGGGRRGVEGLRDVDASVFVFACVSGRRPEGDRHRDEHVSNTQAETQTHRFVMQTSNGHTSCGKMLLTIEGY